MRFYYQQQQQCHDLNGRDENCEQRVNDNENGIDINQLQRFNDQLLGIYLTASYCSCTCNYTIKECDVSVIKLSLHNVSSQQFKSKELFQCQVTIFIF